MIEYKGYVGIFEYQPETENFAGHVEGIRGSITFYGDSVEDLKMEMARSVDEYLAFCEEQGVEPARPYSGRFNVRIPPDRHREVAVAAASSGKSMNDWVAEQLERGLADTPKLSKAGPRPTRRAAKATPGARSGHSRKR